MARRMERSGDLIFFYGSSPAPAVPERESRLRGRAGIWLALLVFVMGMLFHTLHLLG